MSANKGAAADQLLPMLQGAELQGQIRQMCPALSLQQIYKLTEHHHDDWISGGHSSDTLGLLATLKHFADTGYKRVSL